VRLAHLSCFYDWEKKMKKFLFGWLLLGSLVWGDLIIKSGWQLVGLDRDVEDMSLFNNGSVEQVWVYDAGTQKWSGYSPNVTTATKISASYGTISSIKSWQGMWIKSTKEWYLTTPTATNTAPIDKLELKTGWNLISIPINSSLSPKIFKDALAWRYNGDSWQIYDKETTTIEPMMGIKKSDGIWVKVAQETSIDISKESATLMTFENKEKMVAYIESMMIHNSYEIYANNTMPNDSPLAMPEADNTTTANGGSASDATDTTTTNIQEEGVLEADSIINDTHYTYYLNKSTQTIDIRELSKLATNDTTITKTIELERENPHSFYLHNGKLVLLSQEYDSSYNGKLVVDFYNISNILAPSKLESFEIDGNLNSSRVVGDTLYVVSGFVPNAQITYPLIEGSQNNGCSGSSSAGSDGTTSDAVISYDCFSMYDYENPIVGTPVLVPQIRYTNFSGDLVTYNTFYAPYKLDQTPTITTVSSFDLGSVKYLKSVSAVGDSSVVYASQNALYVVSTQYPLYYDYYNYQERSVIYKFGFDDTLTFKGLGFVDGRPLNQFSLSEYNSILRIAVTEGFSWSLDTTNSVFTLEATASNLNIKGYLSSLGKEGETIRAVRFVGERGYVVTFRQTDPLYTIDLSDAANPKKAGELVIDGFSEYIHPIDNNRLLAVGRNADSNGNTLGLLLQLFDVSDFYNPKSVSKIIIGGDSSIVSSAESDHKAFIYRASDNLFSIPYYSWYYYNQMHFGLYKVDGMTIKKVGEILTDNDSKCDPRSVIYDYSGGSYMASFCSSDAATLQIK